MKKKTESQIRPKDNWNFELEKRWRKSCLLQSAKVTGFSPSSRANARELRKISPVGRNDSPSHFFACFAPRSTSFRAGVAGQNFVVYLKTARASPTITPEPSGRTNKGLISISAICSRHRDAMPPIRHSVLATASRSAAGRPRKAVRTW